MKKLITLLFLLFTIGAFAQINVGTNFQITGQIPIDKRTVFGTTALRDALSSNYRYEGLVVYVLDVQKTYQLKGCLTNTCWIEIAQTATVGDTSFFDPTCTGITIIDEQSGESWKHVKKYDETGNQIGCEWVNVSDIPTVPNPTILLNGVYSDSLEFNNMTALGATRPITIDSVKYDSVYKAVIGLDTTLLIPTKDYVENNFLLMSDTVNNPWKYSSTGEVILRDINNNVGIGTNTPTAKFQVSGSNALINTVQVGKLANNYTSVLLGTGTSPAIIPLQMNNCVAIGYGAMSEFPGGAGGNFNTAIGSGALSAGGGAGNNVAIGVDALRNSISLGNTAIGFQSSYSNINGSGNFSMGLDALYSNEYGIRNVAIGSSSGFSCINDYNIYIGYKAGYYDTTDNKLFIHNRAADSVNSTIYADMKNSNLSETPRIRLNGEVMVKSLDTLGGAANYVVVQDPNGGKRLALQALGDCPETIAEVVSDTTSVGKSVGSIQLRITASDTSAWMVIRTTGVLNARWKKLTP